MSRLPLLPTGALPTGALPTGALLTGAGPAGLLPPEVTLTPDDELARLGPIPVPDGEPRPAPEHRGVVWACLALLLAYPDDALLPGLPAVRVALHQVRDRVGEGVVAPLLALADHLAEGAPLAAQQHYVATFDTKRRCCPYLTYYLHGDTRRRGMALWRIKAALAGCGVEPTGGELPDHLTVLCELAATGDESVALALLAEHRAGLTLLGAALEQAGSCYAPAVAVVEALLPAPSPADVPLLERMVRRVAAGPPTEAVGLAGRLAPFTSISDNDRGDRR